MFGVILFVEINNLLMLIGINRDLMVIKCQIINTNNNEFEEIHFKIN